MDGRMYLKATNAYTEIVILTHQGQAASKFKNDSFLRAMSTPKTRTDRDTVVHLRVKAASPDEMD